MATYTYQNQAGQVQEITAPMTNPPPEQIIIFGDGEWVKPNDTIIGDRFKELLSIPADERVWSRVYGEGLGISVTNLACKPGKDGLPVSHASPRKLGGELKKVGDHTIREHKDGTITNKIGQPIIDSNTAAKNNARRTGMELD